MTSFDLGDPAFDVTSPAVHAARDASWYVETTWGWAVLRYAETSALLRDRRFRQGNARWPAQNGIHSGMFSDWWQETLLSLEGEDHARIRKLLMPAFRNRTIAAMRPRFEALAHELIDGFAPRGEVEFVSEFAEPYAARIICVLLGLPEEDWPQVAHWADDLGASFGINVAGHLPRIEAALAGLHGHLDEVVADRQAHPRDDLVTTLLQAQEADGLSRHELGVALVFLAFAGMETTRNQLGLALQTLLRHPDQWRLLGERPDLGERCVEEVMRVNPTVTWVTREALEDVDLPGPAHPPGRHRPDALPRGRHGPVGDARPVLRHHRAAPAPPRFRRRRAPLPGPLRRPHRHGRRPAPAGPADARCATGRARRVAAGVGQHRPGPVPDPLPRPAPGGQMIAVTGSTGTLGGLVARALAGSDFRINLRLLVRDPSRAPDIDCDVRVCDYADEEASVAALTGVDTLFMVSAAEAQDRREQHRAFIRSAARAGVGHIVYTSFSGAAPDATFTLGRDHHDAETAIRESGMAFTFLRDNFYVDVLPWFADAHGVIRGPADDGRVAAVARADVADVASAVLRDPGSHAGATYTLTGPEALTLTEVAARAGAVLGRDLRFEDETPEEAYASRAAAYDVERWQLDAWVSTYTAIADGSCAEVTDDVRRVSGHEARSLEQALTR